MSVDAVTTHPAYIVVKMLVGAFTILGNAFIIFTIVRCKKLRNEKFNLLVVLLALGDIVIGINTPFSVFFRFATTDSALRIIFGISQVLVTYGDHVTQIAMLLVAADRLYIVFRLRKLDSANNLYNLYAASIPTVLLVSLIPVVFFLVDFNNVFDAIFANAATESKYATYMICTIFVFNFSIIGLYLVIAIKYKSQMEGMTNSSQSHFNRIVVGIVVVYFLMWCIPKWINFAVVKAQVGGVLFDFALILPEECELLSAAANVFVYGYTHRDLRNAMKRHFNKVTNTHILTVSVLSSSRQVTVL